MKLHHRIDGPEDGIPLVLINGLFADLKSWDGAMPHLERYRVLRYDGRGQGESPAPEGPYHLDSLTSDLAGLLESLSFPAAHFIGISNGGILALALAARHPGKVRKLAVAGCFYRPTPLLKLKLQSWLKAHLVGGPQHRFDVAAPWIWSEATLTQHPEALDFYRQRAALQSDTAVQGLLKGAMCHEVQPKEVIAETLVLSGAQDVLIPPYQGLDMASKIEKSHFREVPGAHASLLEFPQTFTDTITPFLEEGFHVG